MQGNQEMPGDISVKRDEVHHHHYPAPLQPVTPQAPALPSVVAPVTEVVKSAGQKLWPVVLAAALSSGVGASVPIAYWWLNKPAAAPAVSTPDYQLRLEVKDQP